MDAERPVKAAMPQPAALMFGLKADTVEYGEWKSGKRSEGATYAIFSFTHKVNDLVVNVGRLDEDTTVALIVAAARMRAGRA